MFAQVNVLLQSKEKEIKRLMSEKAARQSMHRCTCRTRVRSFALRFFLTTALLCSARVPACSAVDAEVRTLHLRSQLSDLLDDDAADVHQLAHPVDDEHAGAEATGDSAPEDDEEQGESSATHTDDEGKKPAARKRTATKPAAKAKAKAPANPRASRTATAPASDKPKRKPVTKKQPARKR